MSRRAWRHLATNMGHRASTLAILGLIWVVIGLSVLDPPVARPGIVHVHEAAPVALRIGWWVIPGAVALVFAAGRRGQRDGLGFAALMVPVMIRFASFLWSWVATLFVPPREGDPDGWKAALIWLAIGALVLIISDWPDPPRRGSPQRRRDDIDWPPAL